MIAFLARRILSAFPTLVGISILTFAILNLLPGDPLDVWSPGGTYSAEAVAHLRAELNLERSPGARYLSWCRDLLKGDLGRSVRDGRPVTAILGDALPWSLLLNLCAVLAIYGMGVPFGLFGASVPGSSVDRMGRWILLIFYAVPPFVAALLLQQWLSVRLRWLPLQGVSFSGPTLGARLLDLARHLVLPTVCLALAGWALVARYSRAAFRSPLAREFLAAARAKGISRLRATVHLAAGSLVPFITLIATIIPGLVGGSVIVEQVFSVPGVGRLYVDSIAARDYPVVLGLTLLSGVLVLASHLLVDILYLAADPRIRDRREEENRAA